MDRQPSGLVEQLQSIQFRQRNVIQKLQVENMRLLSDLADIRQERDAFRGKIALARKENTELQNKLDEILTEYQDIKRERAMLLRSAAADTRRRTINLNSKISSLLSIVKEEPTDSSPTAEIPTSSKGKAACPKLQPYLHKELPASPELPSPCPDNHVSIDGELRSPTCNICSSQ